MSRARWRAYQGLIDPRRLVFIDETWTKTNMTRLRGAGRRKASGSSTKVPHGRWKTATFLAALLQRPHRCALPVRRAHQRRTRFRAYVEQFLVPDPQAGRRRHPRQPRLPQGKGHTTSDPRRRGRALVFLPKYSPDLKSDRAGLRQVQDFAAKGRSPNIRRCRRRKRSHPRSIPARRMRRLCEKRRIRVKPNADRSNVAAMGYKRSKTAYERLSGSVMPSRGCSPWSRCSFSRSGF